MAASISKKQLAAKYGIDIKTLRRWLARVPGLELQPYQKILTPAQYTTIASHLGPAD